MVALMRVVVPALENVASVPLSRRMRNDALLRYVQSGMATDPGVFSAVDEIGFVLLQSQMAAWLPEPSSPCLSAMRCFQTRDWRRLLAQVRGCVDVVVCWLNPGRHVLCDLRDRLRFSSFRVTSALQTNCESLVDRGAC